MQPLRPAADSVLLYSPYVGLIDPPNPQVPRYNVSQYSASMFASLSITFSSLPLSSQLFRTLLTQFVNVCQLGWLVICLYCLSVFPILFPPVSLGLPCERLEAVQSAIKTHNHNFLTFLPQLVLSLTH